MQEVEEQASVQETPIEYGVERAVRVMDERYLQPSPQPHSGYGVSIAMLAWSLAFLLFPKFVLFPVWLAYVFYAIGFVALLIGILGLSIEIFKGKQ